MKWCGKSTEGSQLVEFALLLPVLLLMGVGIADLSGALILRDKLTNAAREGARMAASQSQSDLTQADPPSVQQVAGAVANYLSGAGVSASLSGNCALGGTFSWTCALAGGGSIAIQRKIPLSLGTTATSFTRVTVQYPYTMNSARFLGVSNSLTISGRTVMPELANQF